MENVKFALKSTVQALDPACGIWLTGKITNLKEGEVLIKWKNYNTSDWIKESLVRFPLTKRKCQINLGDWKRLRPALYQKGEVVTIKKADGTSGENVVIEENDPFGCVMQGSNRKLKYEWLRESPEDVSVPVQVAAIQTPKPPRPPFQETVGSQKTAGPDVQRSPRATRTAPTASDIENQTPPQHGNKRRQHYTTPRPPKKTKTTFVKKKIASRIVIGEAAPGDKHSGTEPMAPDCAGEATLALLDVVENIASAGTPPKVPEEWLNCTPPLACSAICEAKFQRLEDKFDVRMGQMELLLHQQEEQLQKQEREINTLRELLSERETSFQPPIHQPAEVFSTPSVSEAIGGALEALNNQDRSITQLLSSPSDVGVSPNFQFEKMLIECDQDRSIMARKLMAHFFSVDEMVNGNTSGKGSKQQLDVSRLSEIRRLIFSYAPAPSPQAEVSEWKRLRAGIDLRNRHLRHTVRAKQV